MLDDDLVQMLVCPEARQPVALAPAELVQALNARIARRELCDASGRPIEEPIEAGLLRRDGRVLYPVMNGIPHMLVEAGIRLDQEKAGGP